MPKYPLGQFQLPFSTSMIPEILGEARIACILGHLDS